MPASLCFPPAKDEVGELELTILLSPSFVLVISGQSSIKRFVSLHPILSTLCLFSHLKNKPALVLPLVRSPRSNQISHVCPSPPSEPSFGQDLVLMEEGLCNHKDLVGTHTMSMTIFTKSERSRYYPNGKSRSKRPLFRAHCFPFDLPLLSRLSIFLSSSKMTTILAPRYSASSSVPKSPSRTLRKYSLLLLLLLLLHLHERPRLPNQHSPHPHLNQIRNLPRIHHLPSPPSRRKNNRKRRENL